LLKGKYENLVKAVRGIKVEKEFKLNLAIQYPRLREIPTAEVHTRRTDELRGELERLLMPDTLRVKALGQ